MTKDNIHVQPDSEQAKLIWQRALPFLYPQGMASPAVKRVGIALIKMDTKLFTWAMIVSIARPFSSTITPLYNKFVISYVEYYDEHNFTRSPMNVTASVLACFFSVFISAYVVPIMFKIGRCQGMHASSALISATFRKSIILGLDEIDVGKLQTIMSVDVPNIMQLYVYLPVLVGCLVWIAITAFLVLWNVGYAGLVVLALLMFVLCFNQFYFVRQIGRFNQVLMKERDDKMRRLHEAVSGIRVIKYFTWEESYLSKICEFRRRELFYLLWYLLCQMGYETLSAIGPVVASFCTFLVYTKIFKHPLTASTGFTTFSLFMVSYMAIYFTPTACTSIAVSIESLRRIYSVLSSEDVRTIKAYAHHSKVPLADLLKGEVIVEHGSFT